ncbi:MAG: histidine phosphatase family protein [Myxococcota bacterium]
MLTVFLARHGQTEWNRVKRLQGHVDIELNETGKRQARLLDERLAVHRLDAIYTSPLKRARATANAVAARAPVLLVDGLRERSMGKYEGRCLADDQELEAEFRRRKHRLGDDLDGGETIELFQQRVFDAVDRTVSEHLEDGSILIVGHGATNSMIIGRFLNLELPDIARIWFANDDLYRIESGDGKHGRVWKEMTVDTLRRVEPNRAPSR